jgi:N-acetylneuraminate synthase
MEKWNTHFKIEDKEIGPDKPTYFIADVAANHDGDLGRAQELIYMCAEAGADAAKFQHFSAETIISDHGFKSLGGQSSHQAAWKKSVFEVYKDASLNVDWTPTLQETCKKAGIHFFTSPYSFDLVDEVDKYIPAFKVGSGDITWTGIIEHMAQKGKPMLLACGASSADDVVIAVEAAAKHNRNLCLMQCNTNYTASLENFKYIQLNVLNTFRSMFPNMVLGLSDHTPGHATVLGAIALGARVIEKHFTDDNDREGPDHKFSMNPKSWRDMVDRSRELESALGNGIKKVEDNEKETVILQRRSLRTTRELKAGDVLSEDMIISLRPCPSDGGLPPFHLSEILGRKLRNPLESGEAIRWKDLE